MKPYRRFTSDRRLRPFSATNDAFAEKYEVFAKQVSQRLKRAPACLVHEIGGTSMLGLGVFALLGFSLLSPAVAGESISGEWELVELTQDGTRVSVEDAEMNGMRYLKVKGEHFIQFSNRQSALATFVLDPAKSPGPISLKWSTGPISRQVLTRGIYKIKEGKLTICLNTNSFPKDFVSAPESRLLLLVYRQRIIKGRE